MCFTSSVFALLGPVMRMAPAPATEVGNGLQEGLVLRRVSAADGVRLVVDMLGRIVRVENQLVDIGRAEMKYPGLMMIDPDDGVVMHSHNRLPS